MKHIVIKSLCLLSLSLVAAACSDDDEQTDQSSMAGSNSVDPEETQECEVWELTYDLEGAFDITGTTAGLGDATQEVGPGRLVLRTQNADGAPAAGKTSVLSYELSQDFSVSAGMGKITTTTKAEADGGECGIALGELTITAADAQLDFEACDNGRTTPAEEVDNDWGPSASQSDDPGCLVKYRSQGNVECTAAAALCGFGNLEEGENPQDETWDQKLNALVFSTDLESFEMSAIPVPNAQPSSTSLALSGTLASKECVELPAACQ